MPALTASLIRLEFIPSGSTCDKSVLVMIVCNVHSQKKFGCPGHASVLLALTVCQPELKQGVSSLVHG